MARRKITAEFKFKVTLEALKERSTLEELGAKMNVAPSQISRWVKEFKMNGKNIFTKDNKLGKKIELLEKEQGRLYGIVGELTAKNDWLKKKTGEIGRAIDTPANFIEENLYFSICEQCKWYDISRSQYYYAPTIKEDKFSSLKEKIKEKYTLDPSSGSRRITAALNRDGVNVQRGLIRRLMKVMSLKGLCPKKRLSIRDDTAHKFPYLLKDLEVVRPNQVWSTDITYIITERGHMYLTAIIDVYSRKILAWELSNSLSKEFCITCFNKAVSKYGVPEILNTDQGSQYTNANFVETVLNLGCKLSMDGKGRCLDNVWIERFWRTIKYDFLSLYEFKGSLNLYKGIRWFICYYNDERCHSSLGYKTPNEVYETSNLTFKKIA